MKNFLLTSCINDFCRMYNKESIENQKKPLCQKEDKRSIFERVMRTLYFQYSKPMGYWGDIRGFRSFLISEKNKAKKESQNLSVEVEIQGIQEKTQKKEIVENDQEYFWGTDISKLSLEDQEKLGLNIN